MGSGCSPCASCKLLRRRCAKDCIFAPYFPSDDPHKFAIVHKVFGASNVSKMLQELPVHQRGDAVSSLVYEANARARDPVYGCVGAITYLQDQVAQLQMQLAVAQAEILCIQMHQDQLDQDQPPVYLHQSPTSVGAHHPFNLLVHGDQAGACTDDNYNNNKSFLIQNNQLLNFGASSGNHVIYQDQSFKKEAIYGHDMVS
ncbi:LOB domain-containing protein [Striga asiatica]|uniref:LOB domain-containing protein n=1 Tax=Striga asiatica TaxID=4170 RepID=A0A5A7R3T3_STRAF|nr:LOB domain-containing protein [Striga asiatica]